jgi:NtrC-family two-component system sensor histidine kinase KinB
VRARLGLRARFLLGGSLLVLTTVAAAIWTLVVLSRLVAVGATTLRDTDEITAATATLTSALEREDDALVVIVTAATPAATAAAHDALDAARAVTDAARDRLARSSRSLAAELIASDVQSAVAQYRAAVARSLDDRAHESLERYHAEVNPRLRVALAAVRRARDQRFEEARAATALARDVAASGRRAVIVIALLAVAVAVFVSLALARHVIVPLRQLAHAAEAIRDGGFETRVTVAAGDEIGQVAGAFNDMTARLRELNRSNLAEVLQTKNALEATLRALPDSIALVDTGGRIAATNPAADRLFAALGRPAPRTAADLAALAPAGSRFAEAVLGLQALDLVALEAALEVDLGGVKRRFAPRIVPLAGGAGVVVVLSDVTELARLDQMRTELVALASHELRTPVTTLRMSLLLLREAADGLDPRVRALVETALGGVDQLTETVDEQLDMTRIEAGKLKLTTERIAVRPVIDEVVARSRGRADELGLAIGVRAADAVPQVVADRARLRTVVDNILTNALKYTPRGGSIEVAIEPVAGAGAVEVAITDTGVGVPVDLAPRVFEKFFRVEHHRPGAEAGPGGSGIGLYLCKEIVELHGGTIRCEAGPGGVGTRIAFTVPAAAAAAAAT